MKHVATRLKTGLSALLALVFALSLSMAPASALAEQDGAPLTAQSTAANNKRAKAAFRKYLKRLKAKSGDTEAIYYKFVNVLGDGTVEMVYRAEGTYTLACFGGICRYSAGKVKSVFFSGREAAWGSYRFYKKTKSMVVSWTAQADYVTVYTYRNGKYRQVASKARFPGGISSAAWEYWDANWKPIKKARYNKLYKAACKGAAISKGLSVKRSLAWQKY